MLIVAARETVGEELFEALRSHGIDEETETRLIAPAVTETRLEHAAGTVDDATAEAAERIERSAPELERHGHDSGAAAIGDPDPAMAVGDVLREEGEHSYDEIVLVTRSGDSKRWAEEDAFDRLRRNFELPVTHLELDAEGHVADEEETGPGLDEPDEPQVEGRGRNMPSFSARDVLGIAVAILGTVVLVVLAASCGGDDGLSRQNLSTACYVSMILAGAGIVINVPHVIGLTMFQSVGYRGFFEKLFSRMSLFGTPAAVLISALVSFV